MKVLIGVVAAIVAAVPMFAQKGSAERLAAATDDLKDAMQANDKGIPQDLLDKAECVVVIPNLKQGGFIVGAKYGRGFFSCRRPNGVGWSAPGAIKIEGGKFGFLIGATDTNVIMLVMNRDGMRHLVSDKFVLGGDAAAAAGPVGRSSSAETDAAMHAEILTYSRARGIYAGISLDGSTIHEDDDSNRELYGHPIRNSALLTEHIHTPPEAEAFIHELDRISSRK
ncbi:MAG TPA: lipid-binding SYLF domain-containing protein [Bryobacteraceae bacterium]|jgi:lipid-binding SYLF domain-containing protein|nr:lipid-binding SYLF domain-containing protein [Bryobacteraceae bacterium]